ncbi:unnamed protein product [Peniophora sp. CBMAI 1063]|nr:unnamed protein product [Peniophora sp. CBMAI 1063]
MHHQVPFSLATVRLSIRIYHQRNVCKRERYGYVSLHVESDGDDLQFLTHPLLDEVGLVVQTRLQRFLCVQHECIVPVDRVLGHLAWGHKHLLRKPSQDVVNAWADDLGLDIHAGLPPFPTEEVAEYEGLLKMDDGLLCPVTSCPKGFQDRASLRTHCNAVHKGSRVRLDLAETVSLQRFAPGLGSAKSWFRVYDAATRSSDADIHAFITRVVAETEAASELPVEEYDTRNVEPWHRFTRWPSALKGFTMQDIETLIGPTQEGEPYSALQGLLLDLFRDAALLISETHESALCQLNTPDPERGENHTPFGNHQTRTTLDSYTHIVLKLVTVALRTHANSVCPVDKVNKSRYLGLRLELPTPIHNLVEALDNTLRDDVLDSAQAIEDCHNLLLALWTHEWLPTRGVVEPDPTVLVIAMASMRRTGEFATPHQTTGLFARVMNLQRYLVVRDAHRNAVGTGHAYVRSVIANVVSLAPCYRVAHLCTFRTMQRYMHYGAYLAFCSPSMPHLTWDVEGERMYYKGTLITFEHQREMRQRNQDEAVALYEELRMGLDAYFQHGLLEDDPSNTEPGYNFKRNARNRHLFQRKHILLTLILESPTLRKRFVHIGPDGHETWLPGPLLKWLIDYAAFHLRLLLATELNTAGPARGSELTCLELINTRTAPRSVYVLGRNVVFRRRYHKLQSRTGLDKAIPEPLDACSSHLLIQDMCVLRDFAIFAASKLYGRDPHIMHLFKTAVFVNVTKRFTTDNLSEGIKALTRIVIGREFGVRDNRHQQIGFMRYRSPQMAALQAPEDPEGIDIEAEAAGHSHRVHMGYGVASNVYRGLQEDLTPEFVRRAMDYQRDHHLVPGNLWSTVEESRYIHFDKSTAPQSQSQFASKLEARMDRIVKANEHETRLWMEDSNKKLLRAYHLEMRSVAPQMLPSRPQGAPSARARGNEAHDAWQETEVFPPLPEAATDGQTDTHNGVQDNNPQPIAEHGAQGTRTVPPRAPISVHRAHPIPSPQTAPNTLPPRPQNRFVHDAASVSGTPVAFVPSQDITASAVRYVPAALPPTAHPASALTVDPRDLEAAARRVLGRLVNPNAPHAVLWRSDGQRQAIMECLAYARDALFILATGSGKTWVPVVAALLEQHSLTIIAVPLNAIYTSTRNMLAQAHVQCMQEWQTGDPIRNSARMVLITYDRANSHEFRIALSDAVRVERYIRIRLALDEAQMAVTDGQYRPTLLNIRELRGIAEMQVIALSGTIPPTSEPEVKNLLGLHPHATTIVRTTTNRPELAFFVTRAMKDLSETIRNITQMWEQMCTGGLARSDHHLAIIFVQTGDNGEEAQTLLAALGYTAEFYHGAAASRGRPLTDRERGEMLDRWIDAKNPSPFILATPALGAGYHNPRIIATFHAGLADGVVSLLQQMSRAGRDGQPAFAFALPSVHDASHYVERTRLDHRGKNALLDLIFKDKMVCLRKALFDFVDGLGHGQVCTDNAFNARCSRCVDGGRLRDMLPPERAADAPIQSVIVRSEGRPLKRDASRMHSQPIGLHERTATQDPETGEPLNPFSVRAFAEKQIEEQARQANRIDIERVEWQPVIETLDCFTGVCPLCMMHNPRAAARPICHKDVIDCPHLRMSTHSFSGFRKGIQFPKKKPKMEPPYCFTCYLPNVDAIPHPAYQRGVRKCPHKDKVAPAIFAAWSNPDWRAPLLTAFPDAPQGTDAASFAAWLVAKSDKRSMHNLMVVFAWIGQRIAQLSA